MSDTIIYWLWGLVKTIPEDIIKGLIASFVILLIIKLVNKVKFLNFYVLYTNLIMICMCAGGCACVFKSLPGVH